MSICIPLNRIHRFLSQSMPLFPLTIYTKIDILNMSDFVVSTVALQEEGCRFCLCLRWFFSTSSHKPALEANLNQCKCNSIKTNEQATWPMWNPTQKTARKALAAPVTLRETVIVKINGYLNSKDRQLQLNTMFWWLSKLQWGNSHRWRLREVEESKRGDKIVYLGLSQRKD